MPGQFFFWLNVCTKKYRKSRELTVKGKLKYALGARGIFFKVGENAPVNGRPLIWSRGAFFPTLKNTYIKYNIHIKHNKT